MIDARDLAPLLAIAEGSAREAAALLMTGYRKHPEVEHKGRMDLVTEFDRRSEELLRKRLAETAIAFVGEERGGESAPRGATWYVDPLDGTSNFVHGHPFFAVSIGLTFDGAPILGVVVAPALGITWRGSTAKPAERDGAPCRVSTTNALDQAMLATGFPYDRATSADDNLAAFAWLKKRTQAIRRCGAAAIDLCLVADGTYDAYWERKLKPWDVAAGSAIVVAAGGSVSAYDGRAASVTEPHVVASNGALHATLVSALAEVGLPPGA